MIRLLIIKDNDDAGRGEYFEASQQHLISELAPHPSINPFILSTIDCQQNTIDHHISVYNGNPFIFIAYTHGEADAIYIGNQAYINNNNAYFFGDTLFYACSCLTAQGLGYTLRQLGCRIFIGYNATISSLNPETEPIFYACENEFIRLFLTTDQTIQDCLDAMYDRYVEYVSKLRNNYSTAEASILERNLSAFTILCDKNDYSLTRNSFFV